MSIPIIVSGVTALAFLLVLRVLWLRSEHGARGKAASHTHTVVVLGSGGHTTEMAKLIPVLRDSKYGLITFVAAATDTTSGVQLMSRGIIASKEPIVYIPRIREIFGTLQTKIVFVESICRVTTLSLTGRILYHTRIADQVQVQWPELALKYPRSTYVGILS